MRRDRQRLNDILEALDWIAKAVARPQRLQPASAFTQAVNDLGKPCGPVFPIQLEHPLGGFAIAL
jgi:hypothetical protein